MLIPPEEARDVQEPTSLRLLIFLLPHLTPCQPDRSTGKQRLFPYNKAKPLIKHHRQTLTLIGLNIFGLWLCHSSNNSSGLFQILFLDRKVGKLFGTDNAF